MVGYYDPSRAADIYNQYGGIAAQSNSRLRQMLPQLIAESLDQMAARRQQNAQFIAQLNAERAAQNQRFASDIMNQVAGSGQAALQLGAARREGESQRAFTADQAAQRRVFEAQEGTADRASRLQEAMIQASGRGKQQRTPEEIMAAMAQAQALMDNPEMRDRMATIGIEPSAFGPAAFEGLSGVNLPAPQRTSKDLNDYLIPEPARKAWEKLNSGMPVTAAEQKLIDSTAPFLGGLSGAEQSARNTSMAAKAVTPLLEPIFAELAGGKTKPAAMKKKAVATLRPYWTELNDLERAEMLMKFRPIGLTVQDFEPGAAPAEGKSRVREATDFIWNTSPIGQGIDAAKQGIGYGWDWLFAPQPTSRPSR